MIRKLNTCTCLSFTFSLSFGRLSSWMFNYKGCLDKPDRWWSDKEKVDWIQWIFWWNQIITWQMQMQMQMQMHSSHNSCNKYFMMECQHIKYLNCHQKHKVLSIQCNVFLIRVGQLSHDSHFFINNMQDEGCQIVIKR